MKPITITERIGQYDVTATQSFDTDTQSGHYNYTVRVGRKIISMGRSLGNAPHGKVTRFTLQRIVREMDKEW